MANPRLTAAIRDFEGFSRQTLAGAMTAAMEAANSATSRQVQDLLDVFQRDVGRSERRTFFETLGSRAHSTVIRSYTASRAASGGPAGYRADEADPRMRRYAGGQLLAALSDPGNVYVTTERGILFGPDAAELDQRAAQWFRLNFGALPQAGRRAERFNVSFSNLHLFSVGFDVGPSRAFSIPERGYGGYFRHDGSFYPLGSKESYQAAAGSGDDITLIKRRPTKGIKARHFFDAGLERFVRDLGDPGRDGVGLNGLYYQFYKRGLANVRPTRPPRVSVRTGSGRIIR